MPTYVITDPSAGKKIRLTGDSPPTEQELNQIFSQFSQPQQQAPKPVGVGEDIPTQENIEAELVRAQELTQQPEETFGEKALGVGESILSTATGATTGSLGMLVGNATGALGELTGVLGEGEGEQLGQRLASQFTYVPETKTGREIVKFLGDSLSVLPPVLGTAPLATSTQATRLAARAPIAKKAALKRKLIAEQIRTGNPNTELVTKTLSETGDIITNKTAKRSLNTLSNVMGDEKAAGTVSVLETMSPRSKQQVNKMLDIIDRGRINPVEGQTNRPLDVLGDAVAGRAKAIATINDKSGKRIGDIAKNTNKTVDISAPVNQFESQLRGLGVTFNIGEDGWITPDFSRSKFVGGSQKDLTVLINELKDPSKRFGAAHDLKRQIRDNVSFDKGGQSQLQGQSEKILKDLSKGIDNILDSESPKYKKANESFAKTVAIKDAFDKLAGKDIGIFDDLSSKALGSKARRLVSNAESRVAIEQLLLAAEDTLKGFGVSFKDDIPSLGYIVSRLEDTFNIEPPRSFQGGIDSALNRAAQGQGATSNIIQTGFEQGKKAIGLGDPDFGKKMRAFRSLVKKDNKAK